MKQYWKIKELTAIGYRDELRRADEADYGFDHSPIDLVGSYCIES